MTINTSSEAAVADQYIALASRALARAAKREAVILIDRGPCYRQSVLCGILGFVDTYLPPDSRIEMAIRAERKRIASGHWTADTNRLIALRGHLLARRFDRRFGKSD
jgi:hypothetical protein